MRFVIISIVNIIIKQREYTERKVEGKHLHSHLNIKGSGLKERLQWRNDRQLNSYLKILILRRKKD